MRFLSAAVLAATFSARHPHAASVDSIEASGDKSGSLEQVDAMAMKGFASGGKLQWLKAKELFFVAGELVKPDDFVQVQEEDARGIIARGQADEASDDDVVKAQKAK